jgi:hypothetical protein
MALNENYSIKDLLNNKLVRIIIGLLFFLFIYKIVYHILVFFSIDENNVKMYMAWVAVFILLISGLYFFRFIDKKIADLI